MSEDGLLKGTILVVEDEIELAEIVADIARTVAQEVYVAHHGKEALEIIKTSRVDAVLSDIQMPIMNGLDLLKNIRAEGYSLPLAFLSAQTDNVNLLSALRLGAADFIYKPGSNKVIKKTLEHILSVSLMSRELTSEIESSLRDHQVDPEEVARTLARVQKIKLLGSANEACKKPETT